MSAATYTPKLQVLLTKIVARTNGVAARYARAPRQIDIAPYVDDAGVVRAAKRRALLAGVFSLTVADQPDHSFGGSLYRMIEPLGIIELGAGRQRENCVDIVTVAVP